jgi:hypothetical protein
MLVAGAETAGIAGTDGAELPTLPVMGDTFAVGSVDEGLTPRLPISSDPNGTPVRALAVVVDDDEVVVGVDDAAMLLEPEPHIPDNPDVSSIPEVVDSPDVAEIADDVDIPGVAMVPDVAPVLPLGSPPPSYVAVDPYSPDGEIPTVEHAIPLLVFGTLIVPVTPLGTGLTSGDTPGGDKPFGPTGAPGSDPSEEVAPSGGMSMPTWASAGLQHSKGNAVATKKDLMEDLSDKRGRIA